MSDETICHSIYVQGRGALRRELEAALRNGRVIRADDRPSTGAAPEERS